jgi:uncharacterized protein
MAETVLISGASGLVGKECLREFRARGYDVLKLVRHLPTDPDEVQWSAKDGIKLDANRTIDHVVHLAGEPIFSAWTKEKKQRIFESRVNGTRTIAEFCASRVKKPKTLVAASAIGIYGDRGDEVLTESSAPGIGFLADVARAWEAASAPAKSVGIRVVNLRIGVVLSSHGGALAMMKLPFELGLGGRIGSGKQWMSWIALDDLVDIIVGAVENTNLSGAYNCTAPEPVTNADFVDTLGYVLNRPTIFPVPGFVLKRLPGDMASETFLSSERVIPQRLLESGFAFKYPRLIETLAAIFHKELQQQIGA